jgi:hypothetical protein
VNAADVLFDLAEHLAVTETRQASRAEPGAEPVRNFLRELAVGVPRE